MTYAFGVVGLGVMGANLARNIESRGFPVAGYDLDAAKVAAFTQGTSTDTTFGAGSPDALMAALERPRRVLMMVPAGAPVDAVIAHLVPHLETGDILIDGGNSYFRDTDRRSEELAARGIQFLGAGVSGGEEGALRGPAIMPGGPREAWEAVAPVLQRHRRQGRRRRAVRRVHGRARRRTLREDGAQRHRVRRHAAHRRNLRCLQPRAGPVRARDLRTSSRSGTPASCVRISSRSAPRSSPMSTRTRAARSSTSSWTRPSRRAPASG